MNCGIQGVVKVQHQTGKIVRQTEKLVVTFLAEKQPGKPNLGAPCVALKWVTLSQLRELSSFVVDTAVRLMVQSVHSGGAVYPVSLVECIDVQGSRKGYDSHTHTHTLSLSLSHTHTHTLFLTLYPSLSPLLTLPRISSRCLYYMPTPLYRAIPCLSMKTSILIGPGMSWEEAK